MVAKVHFGMANFDPSGMVSRIYVGDDILNIQAVGRPNGFKEGAFSSFASIIQSIEPLNPWGGASFVFRGLICRIYVGNH